MHSQTQSPCPPVEAGPWSNARVCRCSLNPTPISLPPRSQGQCGISTAQAIHHCIREPAQYQLSSALVRATYGVNVKYERAGSWQTTHQSLFGMMPCLRKGMNPRSAEPIRTITGPGSGRSPGAGAGAGAGAGGAGAAGTSAAAGVTSAGPSVSEPSLHIRSGDAWARGWSGRESGAPSW